MKRTILKTAEACTLLFILSASSNVYAGAIHDQDSFTTRIAENDDNSTLTALGMTINFFGTSYSDVYINTNGNVSFDAANGNYQTGPISSINKSILAPFFADVDTRTGNTITYGNTTINGRTVFGVNWIDVGYYNRHTDKLNSFQLIITDRNDTGLGNFDFEFNYDKIQWESGDASGGIKGLGGSSALSGWTNGSQTYHEFAGSGINSALLDGSNLALTTNTSNSNTPGHYIFTMRNSVLVDSDINGALLDNDNLALASSAIDFNTPVSYMFTMSNSVLVNPIAVSEPNTLILISIAMLGCAIKRYNLRPLVDKFFSCHA
ncbi:nidogen-like domain-containing protein [Crenothrix polyspora]|uniref:NIDO domain-containing protein n=1 Tax=Crenothrix polyspora TaxID=360316 RepID=A0A1R4H542_9GAMM|nr:nidogen-like domain-containing protein [Crenothrix polyspora]SJM91373.1 conserved exported hypothetical protein [Crenothrix polyspora]